MNRLLVLLLIVILCGCSDAASHTAEKISSRVQQTCSSLCISPAARLAAAASQETESISVFSASVLERNGQILTW
jgi:ABC-type molybdate transport system substrate-binding protein